MNHSPSKQYSFEGRSLTWEILSRAISDANIPFALDRLQWRGDQRKGWTRLKNQDDLFSCILDFTRCKESLASNSTAEHKGFQLVLSLVKKIILPHHEFEEMVKAKSFEELARELSIAVSLMNRHRNTFSSPSLDRMSFQPFRERREELGIDSLDSLIDGATRALAEQEGSKLIPATKSSIEALEDVTLDGVDHSTSSCAICLENMVTSSPVTCLPCSHKFHKTCIVLWLERSPMCPLCRFELSTIN
ncbi:unnamed protein product [Dovyalis caffra]|uniref:RING-type domain-containing protein n=1 Tax=Dovyalis caffra TaxID=77055 RepID=A0AAV1SP63_9ROSI|nr:unnamed protein product [Dovyalis caffra]